MKILVITSNIGRTAPGIVFERLIDGLSKVHELDVITAENDATIDLSGIRITEIPKKKQISSRLHKASFSAFGVSFHDLSWVKKVMNHLESNHVEKYDLVFSMASYGHYSPMMTGKKIALRWNKRHFVYSVDAIPAPVGWLKDDLFYRKTKRLVAKSLADVDGLFSANEKMLAFQLDIVKPKKNIISGVVYNPSYGGVKTYGLPADNTNVFLYTGGIYGQRKPKYILGAFRKLLQTYPDSRFEFVGTAIPEEAFSDFTKEERDKIVIHGFAKDLQPFYERATALIDIDADLPDDIYLSSKMTNYIMINRPIICETGENSPSMTLFKGIPSIFQCGHNVDALAAAMCKAVEQKGKIDFEDRKEVIALFNLENIVEKINNTISL